MHYAVVLGLIPVALVGIAGVLTIAGFDPTTAVPVGALVFVGVIGHAMFINVPVDPVRHDATTEVDATTAAIGGHDGP